MLTVEDHMRAASIVRERNVLREIEEERKGERHPLVLRAAEETGYTAAEIEEIGRQAGLTTRQAAEAML